MHPLRRCGRCSGIFLNVVCRVWVVLNISPSKSDAGMCLFLEAARRILRFKTRNLPGRRERRNFTVLTFERACKGTKTAKVDWILACVESAGVFRWWSSCPTGQRKEALD